MSDKHIQISYPLANILFYHKFTCIFHHLRIFVVQICRRHLRTFSANFVWPEKETPPTFSQFSQFFPKFRKNSARVDFATFQDELKPKFLAKI